MSSARRRASNPYFAWSTAACETTSRSICTREGARCEPGNNKRGRWRWRIPTPTVPSPISIPGRHSRHSTPTTRYNTLSEHTPPLIGFAAFSGTGKTTLLEQLLPLLCAHGLRIALIKHAHHTFDIDHPGKDSYRLRKAGAQQMLIASRCRRALITETPDAHAEPGLAALLLELDTGQLDLILVEGFKLERFPKIELHRPTLGHPLLAPDDDTIIAVATDAPLASPIGVAQLDINQPAQIAQFVLDYIADLRAPVHRQTGAPPGSPTGS